MASIGFVHDNPTPSANDDAIIAVLEGAGHTVTLINETASPPAAGTHDLIIISESGSSSSVAPYDTYADPVMVWETAWNSLRLSSAGATSTGSTTQVDLVGHASTTGLPDPLTYLSSATSMFGVASSSLPAGVEIVGRHPTTTTHCFCIVAEAGATLTSGTAPARRCAMGLIDSRVGSLTTDGHDLVLAMVDWLSPSAPPNQGTASGGYTFSGTAVGNTPPHSGTAAGSYAFSGTATGTNKPPVPTGLTATPVSGSQIDLSWDAVSGVSGYDIERDGVVIVFNHASTSYSDTGLTPLTSYDYRVRSVD